MSDGPRLRVVLAAEPDFRLGLADVRPALRQVTCGEAGATLEPRVMQVLVALAGTPGRVVGRDELIARCWDGRVVGDNAIDRAVSRLRRLAVELPGAGFEIETLSRVGYRLRVTAPAATPPQAPRGSEPPPAGVAHVPRRRRVLAGTAVGLAAVVGIGATTWAWRGREAQIDEGLRRARALRLGGGDDLLQAAALLQEVIRLSPGSAAAWGMLALTQAEYLEFGDEPADAANFPQPTSAVTARALALGPTNGDAAAAYVLNQRLYGNWWAVEESCRRALERWPQHPTLHDTLGRVYSHTGRWAEATTSYRRSLALEAQQPCVHARLITALWSSRQHDDATRVAADALKAWPEHGDVWLSSLRWRLGSGREDEAIAQLRRLPGRPRSLMPISDDLGIVVARALADGGTQAAASACAALLAARGAGSVSSFDAAPLFARLGQTDLALQMFETYYLGGTRPSGERQPPPMPGEVRKTDVLFLPPCDPLRADRRYARLTRTIGLDAYWQAVGRGADGVPSARV